MAIFIAIFLSEILDNSNLTYDEIAHYSLGVAGISNKDARDLLFKKLEDKQISKITHLSSDVNPVFEMNCSDNSALLVSVGTGCICLGRDDENKIIKSAGMGLDKDPGSGFWMGRELIVNLSFSRNLDQDETEFQELLDMLNRPIFYRHLLGFHFQNARNDILVSVRPYAS